MKLRNSAPVVLTLFLLLAVLAIPVQASTLALDITGTLGPSLFGTDRLGLSGIGFTLTGVIDQGLSPIYTTADSATYSLPGDLEIALGLAHLVLTGYNATLTLTDPASGPDILEIGFGATEFNFNPDVTATLYLPPGTLHGTGLQDFWAYVSQPDSSLSYTIPGVTDEVEDTLGVTGTVTLSGGAPSSGVPEPATIGLLAVGLLAVVLKAGKLRRS